MSKVTATSLGAAARTAVEYGGARGPERANILVVDDHADKLLVLQTILEDLHENVVSVRSGREALKCLLEREFAVILLDVKMPEMDGFETAKLIRGRRMFAHTPIIFVTAYEDEMRTAEGYSLGAVDYILTPIVPEVLRSKVSVFVQLFHMRNQIERQAEERIALMREQASREVAEASIRRSTLLAEASRVLSGSLDVATTARGLTRFVVPALAPLCALGLADASGRVRQTEIAWARGEGGPVEHASVATVTHERLAAAIEHAVRTGDVGEVDLETSDGTLAVEPTGVVSLGFPLRHVLLLPLHARERRLGVLMMGASASRAAMIDRALAADLAGRTAIALDNALLYSTIQDADRRKDEFLAMLAHELRNPLAPIRNALSVLRLSLPQEEGVVYRSQGIIDRQVEQLTRIVDDLLDVSRLTQGKIRLERVVVELTQVLERALETSRPWITDRRHVLTLQVPDAPVFVCGDPVRLAQVFANLVGNAAKYTPEGGRIHVEAGVAGDEVIVRVRDDGAGIPADVLPHVFDLFTQGNRSLARSEGGLGIGLTVVRSLLEKHGGSVEARSEGVGKGSEFTVRLPVADAATAGAATETVPETPVTQGGVRILLVDDNADANEALEELLRLDGQDVRTALDGPSALRIAREWRPQLVLCDLGLPGMDGYEVIRHLREQSGDAMPVTAAVTGYARAEDKRRTRDAGFDHHLAKPVSLDALRALVAAQRRDPPAI